MACGVRHAGGWLAINDGMANGEHGFLVQEKAMLNNERNANDLELQHLSMRAWDGLVAGTTDGYAADDIDVVDCEDQLVEANRCRGMNRCRHTPETHDRMRCGR